MSLRVEVVATKQAVRDFLLLPWRIYRGDPNWVPPLFVEMKRILDPRRNGYLRKGPHAGFLVYRDGLAVGRVLAGIDEPTNAAKGTRDGWFSLFETLPDYEAAKLLLEAAADYLAGMGMERMRGPVSPTGGDDYRGVLVEGFDRPPVLMNSYNPPYYPEFLERAGLVKCLDLYAYYFPPRPPKNPRAVEYAERRFGFRVEPLDLRHLRREIKAIKAILDRAVPAEWPDMIPPSEEEVWEMAQTLKTHADPELVFIARAGGEPIGFNITLPDLNQALIHLDGRLFPFGWWKFLYWKRRIDAIRFFVLFVVPEWRHKGVSAAIFHHTFLAATWSGPAGSTTRPTGSTNVPYEISR
ncbi:MAG: GNAT family N-acetyltransferase [Bacillota bacterium]